MDEGLSLEAYAAVCAALAEGNRRKDEILRANALSDDAWDAACFYWNHAILADEMSGGEAKLADAYCDAFARAQDALKPVPRLDPDEWAEVTVAVARRGLEALPDLGLTRPDYARLARVWTRILTSDRVMADKYNAALFALTTR